ncbi:hypothetical protein Pla163_01330 [Planctomycetes bacterium Pla163]|uniref:Histidine kinase/HSP90-like ATPase domain-containing protein n=1 Tax=Rohdeia mirabilis TaxID=2528008 RepID=A0A518CUY6_9BACT|nr:hypothetical protein Pla163_01330 [Planctomycetes bacterium Pla163]
MSVGEVHGVPCVRVENDAPDLDPSELAILSEPFWRKDGARTDRSRAGLGLALSSGLAASAGAELRFRLDDGRFRAELIAPNELA